MKNYFSKAFLSFLGYCIASSLALNIIWLLEGKYALNLHNMLITTMFALVMAIFVWMLTFKITEMMKREISVISSFWRSFILMTLFVLISSIGGKYYIKLHGYTQFLPYREFINDQPVDKIVPIPLLIQLLLIYLLIYIILTWIMSLSTSRSRYANNS